jgi:acetolactate synthase-1/3 small subunit
VHQEIALYKIATESFVDGSAEHIVRNHHARILTVDKEFTIIEKTGQPEELQDLFNELDQYGVLEFVRSGRVAISKPMKTLETYLKELESE